jgi:hypothetical protein
MSTSVVRVSSLSASGHGRNGGSSKSSLHIEKKKVPKKVELVGVGNECPLKE